MLKIADVLHKIILARLKRVVQRMRTVARSAHRGEQAVVNRCATYLEISLYTIKRTLFVAHWLVDLVLQ